MKFAKKFFVGIVAVALLVSCLTLSTSAESAPKLPSENLEDVLEYLLYDEPFIVEDYDDEAVGAFTPVSSFFDFVTGAGATLEIVADSTSDNSLLITNVDSTVGTGYKLDLTESGEFKDLFVTSFDFKTGDADGNNGSDFYVVATLNDYFDNIVLFAAKAADDANKSFSYSEYNSDRVTYDTVIAENVAPELGVWYHVEIVFSVAQSKYSITVKTGEEVVFSFADEISSESDGIASLRYYVVDPKEAGTTKTGLDNVIAYEGAAVRDVITPNETSAEFVAAIQALADDPNTSIEKKLEIAELYKDLFGNVGHEPYAPVEGVTYYDEAKAAADGFQAYINQTYANALITYLDQAEAVEGYYEQIAFYEENVLPFYNMFGDDGINSESVGMDAIYSAEFTYYDAVTVALSDCDKLTKSFKLTADFCDNFIVTLESGYDPTNKDYRVMLAKYGALSALKSRVEGVPEYNYAAVNPDTKYPTIADAIAAYDELEAKIQQIVYNVENVFLPAVAAMDITQFDTVSEASPYLTKNFETLYVNYLKALTVYKNGTVHEGLDPATYSGLSAAIELFDEYAEYVESRVNDCLEFVSRVNGAASSTYYVTIRDQLEFVKVYFDDNKEYALEKYEGVDEAISTYKTLLERKIKNEADAKAYIDAVAKIDLEASYLQLKAAVDAALALKADGDVTGIDGVEAANVKLAEAEAIVSSLGGHSSTLIEAVNALKTATTFAERRNLIFIANGAKDSAEESISGVTAAKAELANQIAKYNSDIAAANGLFSSVVETVSGTMSSAVASDACANSFAVVGAVAK